MLRFTDAKLQNLFQRLSVFIQYFARFGISGITWGYKREIPQEFPRKSAQKYHVSPKYLLRLISLKFSAKKIAEPVVTDSARCLGIIMF